MKNFSIGLVVLASMVSLAAAEAPKHVKGGKATELARALKFAGVKATTAKTVRTYTAASISCSSTREGQDEWLGDYTCSVDKLTVRDAAALLLQNALEGAGLNSSDGMSKHKTNATAVSCVIDPGKAADDRFDCAFVQGPT